MIILGREFILKKIVFVVVFFLICTFCGTNILNWHVFADTKLIASKQINIARIEKMPNIPPQFKMKNWKETAINFDKFVFDLNAKGELLPLIWMDKTQRNFPQDTFGIPSYVGDNRQKGGENHEGITAMAAVLGASLSGIDKSNQNSQNWVKMCLNYFNKDNGENLVLDLTNTDTGHTFWYEIYPSMLFYSLSDIYSKETEMKDIVKIVADRWYDASYVMGGKVGKPNFDYNSFDFDTMKPVDENWTEPDSSAGIAWLEYMAYAQWKDKKYLQAADWGMKFLNSSVYSPYYEVLFPYGAYVAARMNAEQNRKYDVKKLVDWCFEIDPMSARPGIGVAVGKWGKTNVDGLFNVFGERQYYAFAMNTFSMASPLVPLVRYDSRFARAIGKWMLNAANNSRLFYADAWPTDQQSSSFWKEDANNSIAYEGLNQNWAGKTPYAMGDPLRWGWGETDFGIYGSSHVGIFGGIISSTNDEKILKLDCLKTDFFHDKAYPTYLYYNPYKISKSVQIDVGNTMTDLYDTVSKKIILKGIKGKGSFKISPDSAAVLVLVPSNGKMTYTGKQTKWNNVVIDYSK